MTYTMAENVTCRKKIIGVYTGSKICTKAQHFRQRGQQFTCPNHPGRCTANLQQSDSIGDESRALAAVIRDVQQDVQVGSVTADGDSQTHKAIGEDTSEYLGTRHFGQTLQKRIENAEFNDNVFCAKTKSEQLVVKKRFALDVTKRCNAEFQICYSKNKGNISLVKRHLSYVIDAVIKCYSGDCSLCSKHSFVCSGKSHRFLLPLYTKLNFTNPEDIQLFRACLNYRLGRKAVDLTQLNSNTQKVESVNRTYQKTNPKTVTWIRNFPSRIHSAVHLRNNSFAKSTQSKMSSLGLRPSPRIIEYLQRKDSSIKTRLLYNKSTKHRKFLYQKRKNIYALYDMKKGAFTLQQ